MFRVASWVRLLVLLAPGLLACNLNDSAPAAVLLSAGEGCERDASCASGHCLVDTQVCAARCEERCQDPGQVCFEGSCVPPDYCREGAGPGCEPPGCDPTCGPGARCDLEATGGPQCLCEEGFEGDGEQCQAIVEDPCLTDNGGCGDPEFFTCTHTGDGERTCADVDLCAEDNGGCGDPERYICVPLSGEPPICRLMASCDVVYEVPLVEDTYVSMREPTRSFADQPYLVTHPEGAAFEIISELATHLLEDLHQTYLKFDLSELPTFPVVRARLETRVMAATPHFGLGRAELHLVANDWSAPALNFENQPPRLESLRRQPVHSLFEPLSVRDILGFEGHRMTQTLYDSLLEGQSVWSLMLETSGIGLLHYAMEHEGGEKAPKLLVTLRECNHMELGADANATVNNREPESALGEGDGLVADRDRSEFYVRFDMSQVPVGARIIGAQLDLVALEVIDYGGEGRFTVELLNTEVWGESTVTYLTRPEATGDPLASFTLDFSDGTGAVEPVTLDTTELFEAVIARFESERSVSLRISATDDAAIFAGRNFFEEAWRPRLTLIYE
ncbi:hypothetical protein DL240_14255 [Lujinxingia litoralis]|uniref:EGF-like domain-containing protein n=1 Tax=Lujinxingia litoralis TaxID=2211119 RepID=A0A328C5T6_9DELT|nr:DNRLRE domain-containing protein [Lujinxingia litoralis]RAL21282.1 hypothetical protein DL240_14255 [Lujinxingia litoralis]